MYHQPAAVIVVPARSQVELVDRELEGHPREDGEAQREAREDHLHRGRAPQADHRVPGGLERRPVGLRHQARGEEMPHLHAQARLDDDLGELQERHHEQEPAVDQRVMKQRDRDPAPLEQRQQHQRHPRRQDEQDDLQQPSARRRGLQPQPAGQVVGRAASHQRGRARLLIFQIDCHDVASGVDSRARAAPGRKGTGRRRPGGASGRDGADRRTLPDSPPNVLYGRYPSRANALTNRASRPGIAGIHAGAVGEYNDRDHAIRLGV